MKKEFLTSIINALNTQKQEITARQAIAAPDIDVSGDEVDQIQGKILANIQAQLMVRNAGKMKMIDATLLKIAEGTFGTCEECSEEISEKRLEFNPLFINCIGCAEQLELEAKKNRRL